MPGRAGTLIAGRYLLREPAGQDGDGLTWPAYDRLLDRDVAVREVAAPPRSARDGGDALPRGALDAGALGAARAAARLDGQPGAATVYDVVEHEGVPWIVMRLAGAAETGVAGPAAAGSGPAPSGAGPAAPGPLPGPAPGVPPSLAFPPRRRLAVPGAAAVARAARGNPRLAVGLATALAMILMLVLVVTVFPSHPKAGSPGGAPAAPGRSATP